MNGCFDFDSIELKSQFFECLTCGDKGNVAMWHKNRTSLYLANWQALVTLVSLLKVYLLPCLMGTKVCKVIGSLYFEDLLRAFSMPYTTQKLAVCVCVSVRSRPIHQGWIGSAVPGVTQGPRCVLLFCSHPPTQHEWLGCE